MENIKQLINKYLESETAHIGIGFKDLKTAEELYINKDDTFPAASVFKILLLVELYRQKLDNKINLNDRYKYKEEERSIGSGVLKTLAEPINLSYIDYATLMMIISDNTATDVIFNKLGKEKIKSVEKYLELQNTKSDLTCNDLVTSIYGVSKFNSYEETLQNIKGKSFKKNATILVDSDGDNNITTPGDMVKVLSKIYNREILDDSACEDILNIMKACQTNSRLPRYIPNTVDIAHKTGTLDRVANDVGIIYHDNSDYILAVFYNGNLATDEDYYRNVNGTVGEDFIANLSKELYDYISIKK